jgi:SAM-dependent methyltransferase
MTEIPWPDNTFDFVFATSVFEHVADQELAYSEIHRVLKPGGLFLNIFPSKWRPIEAHINVPLGGVLRSRRYLRLCTALGIRGVGQEKFTADRVLDLNRQFLTHGVNYLAGRQIADLLHRIFGEFAYVEDAFISHSPGRSRYLAIPLKVLPILRYLFRFAHTRVILARKRR